MLDPAPPHVSRCAALSYHFLAKLYLRLKERFAFVRSRVPLMARHSLMDIVQTTRNVVSGLRVNLFIKHALATIHLLQVHP
jgi:hypothetical protein